MAPSANLAPIVMFVYNRPEHTRMTIESLLENDLATLSNLFIYADGPRNSEDREQVDRVRTYLKTINGFLSVSIIEREHNYGLAKSVITGVTEVIDKFGKAIVVEDDLVSSKDFLSFMNKALGCYEGDERIFSVTGYSYPFAVPEGYKHRVYLSYRCCSWGWGTWRDRWTRVDWEVKDVHAFLKDREAQRRLNRGGRDLTGMLLDQMRGEIDSWAIRWCYAHSKNEAYCLYPVESKIKNIGFDRSGTHCGFSEKKYYSEIGEGLDEIECPIDIDIDESLVQELNKLFVPTIKQSVASALKKNKSGEHIVRIYKKLRAYVAR